MEEQGFWEWNFGEILAMTFTLNSRMSLLMMVILPSLLSQPLMELFLAEPTGLKLDLET